MCTLAAFRDVSARFPLVIAANRDEFADRPSLAPQPLAEDAGIVAGRDLRAGGTWLGCRVDGEPFAAGLLNRRVGVRHGANEAAPVSRGTLCLGALRHRSLASALDEIRTLRLDAYDPFNLLLVDRARGVVVDNRDGFHATELGTGLSVLTNLDVNDPRCPRLASAHAGFERVAPVLAAGTDEEAIVEALASVLRDHASSSDASGDDPFARVCVHAGAYGTRSSSIVLVGADGSVGYYHADDAPCRAAFRRVTVPASSSLRR
jgi:uncharacterized protein with NRDE domain